MESKIKVFLKPLFSLLTLIIIAFLTINLVFLIPTNGRIEKNVKESIPTLKEEGAYYQTIKNNETTTLDNYTDAIMLLSASYNGTQPFYKNSMSIPKVNSLLSDSSFDTLVNHYTDDNMSTSHYARYWHGYLVVLKPLLMFFDYDGIRVFNFIFQISLLCFVVYSMCKQKKQKIILPFLSSLVMMTPFVNFFSLQYSSVYYIVLISTLVLLYKEKKFTKQKWKLYGFFMSVGAITSFFDLLTYPIVTLGFPLIISLYITNSKSFKETLITIIKLSILWGVGYFSMWASKWVLASLILQTNVIEDALNTLFVRTSSEKTDIIITYTAVLKRNIMVIPYFYYIPSIMIIIKYICTVFNKKVICFKSVDVLYFIIALMPFVWYYLIKNHSYIHNWFTFRGISIAVFAVLIVGLRISERSECDSNK